MIIGQYLLGILIPYLTYICCLFFLFKVQAIVVYWKCGPNQKEIEAPDSPRKCSIPRYDKGAVYISLASLVSTIAYKGMVRVLRWEHVLSLWENGHHSGGLKQKQTIDLPRIVPKKRLLKTHLGCRKSQMVYRLRYVGSNPTWLPMRVLQNLIKSRKKTLTYKHVGHQILTHTEQNQDIIKDPDLSLYLVSLTSEDASSHKTQNKIPPPPPVTVKPANAFI